MSYWRKHLFDELLILKTKINNTYFFEYFKRKKLKKQLENKTKEYKEYCKIRGYVSYNYL